MIKDLASLLLTPAEMTTVDAAAAASGIDSFGLMERAGAAVAAIALRHYPGATRVVVLCGPGNNGGDGYVSARHLHESGAQVSLFHLGDPTTLKGDAARAREECPMSSVDVESYTPDGGDVVIDALFGAGLAREVSDDVHALIDRVKRARVPVIAVDLPSGIDGRTGEVLGAAFSADRTITFMTRKPGHLLMPGRELSGSLEVFDIGIPSRIVRAVADGKIGENRPEQWRHLLPSAALETHKYIRGHLVVFSGEAAKQGRRGCRQRQASRREPASSRSRRHRMPWRPMPHI